MDLRRLEGHLLKVIGACGRAVGIELPELESALVWSLDFSLARVASIFLSYCMDAANAPRKVLRSFART